MSNIWENKNNTNNKLKNLRVKFFIILERILKKIKIIIYNKQFDRNKQFITIKQHYSNIRERFTLTVITGNATRNYGSVNERTLITSTTSVVKHTRKNAKKTSQHIAEEDQPTFQTESNPSLVSEMVSKIPTKWLKTKKCAKKNVRSKKSLQQSTMCKLEWMD